MKKLGLHEVVFKNKNQNVFSVDPNYVKTILEKVKKQLETR